MKFKKQVLLLLLWIVIGLVLRISNLNLKPPWSDEWATLVFSLGNSFRTVPLDEIISLDTLLTPLKLQANTNTHDVINNLLTESTHPPLYFILNHWWLKLLGNNGELVSVWWGRLLSSLLGVVAISAIFSLSWIVFQSKITAHLTALLIALSPWHIYLSQEARHYTLSMLWIIASLGCLIIATTYLKEEKKLPFVLVITWIIINTCAVATHYFLGITLVSEVIVLFIFGMQEFLNKKNILTVSWQRIYLAIIGTLFGCSVWFFTWLSIPDNQLTSWIFQDTSWLEFYQPIARLCLWVITMFILLPVEGVNDKVAIVSGVILLVFLVWIIPKLILAFKASYHNSQFTTLWQFLVGAIAFILIINYLVGADLTLSARFQFIYFPAIILLSGYLLSYFWSHKKVIFICLIMGLCGGLTVINNYGFQKVERPDLIVPIILEANENLQNKDPVIIATRHKSHGQTGEMMSIAWQFQKTSLKPQFLLAHQLGENEVTSDNILRKKVSTLSRPFKLWLVNFSVPDLGQENCLEDEEYKGRVTGYKYKLYHCKIKGD